MERAAIRERGTGKRRETTYNTPPMTRTKYPKHRIAEVGTWGAGTGKSGGGTQRGVRASWCHPKNMGTLSHRISSEERGVMGMREDRRARAAGTPGSPNTRNSMSREGKSRQRGGRAKGDGAAGAGGGRTKNEGVAGLRHQRRRCGPRKSARGQD